ncbi:hypothetical protein QVZ41_06435 [Wenyingzhuangia sp. chi5]|uniref:DED domain-containing protein n=1 Tax=Wenyingzhuangia gilva TaxID=3057677 RepID=A0ABT8VR92_9FLAO|nr:hypothetical protein [Wenyingzhuangia sp. chi5]MDO3694482.1 hypothetical protein [Wenyingzhuangia sp. chi5]
MIRFNKKIVKKGNVLKEDTGIKVSDLVKLLGEDSMSIEFLELLNFKSIEDEFINIKGATTIVETQKLINSKFNKIDLLSSLNNISLYDDMEFTINFHNICSSDYFEKLGVKNISVSPIYSAKRDFFTCLYQMDKYANKIIQCGYSDLVKLNFDYLKKVCAIDKKYRILHEIDEDKYYLRAIISQKKYHNYDNNLTIVIGLLTLHEEMKRNNVFYSLNMFEYNESFVKMYFESSDRRELKDIGYVKNIIIVSNDEIKREALRFSAVCSIVFDETKFEELIMLPRNIKSDILSIKHNQVPKTAISELRSISDAKKIHDELFEDISKIHTIRNPEQIKFLVREKIEKAKRDEVKKIKGSLINELDKKRIRNVVDLLSVFKKIELLAEEDIDALSYLRFIIYQALILRK